MLLTLLKKIICAIFSLLHDPITCEISLHPRPGERDTLSFEAQGPDHRPGRDLGQENKGPSSSVHIKEPKRAPELDSLRGT